MTLQHEDRIVSALRHGEECLAQRLGRPQVRMGTVPAIEAPQDLEVLGDPLQPVTQGATPCS
jgi:hypothetical protein